MGCSSGSGSAPPGTGSGGSEGGTVAASGGVNTGGATTAPTGSGGAAPGGGTPTTGGQTQSQAGSMTQGGSTIGSAPTSAAGQTAAGGSSIGGRATGGGSATGGSVAGGSATGGGGTGGTPTGGTVTGGGDTGVRTSIGGATGGVGTGGKTTTGGSTSASGGAATGGTTAVPPIGGGLGSSDGKTPIKVWMAGDSTMAGGPTTACAACPCGYGSQLDPLFNSNVTVVNNAVGGLTIQTWLYQGVSSTMVDGECAVTNTAFQSRWTNMLSGTSAMKAGDYLFISFGINDGDANCPKHIGEAKYLGYLNLMVKAAKELGVEPILMPPVGAIDCGGGSTAVNIRKAYFTTASNDAGTANNVPVIDLGQLSIDLYNSLGLCPNTADYTSNSKVGQFFCQDHTHFELAGAKQIAQLVAKALKDQGIGLGAYVLN